MKLISITLASVLMASCAFAADLAADASYAEGEYASAPFTWDGLYGGIQGGYGWGQSNFFAENNFNGGLVTGYLGYNWQFDTNLVIGIEGDVSHNFNETGVNNVDINFDTSGSLRGRVGYSLDKSLVYAAAGWNSIDVSTGNPKRFNGGTVGLGLDYLLTDNIFYRTEYRYNNYVNSRGSFHQNIITIGVGYKF